MPFTEWGYEITREELAGWILVEDGDVLAVDKPGGVVCHPSKHGPWSSLIGACREYTGLERLYMPSRLDRETSGVVVFGKHREIGSALQRAIQARRVAKTYLAVVHGEMRDACVVREPIGRAEGASVLVRRAVAAGGQEAETAFEPLAWTSDWTLARVRPHTGRLHQIRVHAEWLGHPLVGDKIYGSDGSAFLEFIEHGFTEGLAKRLPLRRHALHATRIEFDLHGRKLAFEAPLAGDLREFCKSHGLDTTHI
jgi:23S rRNA pseudouridine1911/1915/1917 synthase